MAILLAINPAMFLSIAPLSNVNKITLWSNKFKSFISNSNCSIALSCSLVCLFFTLLEVLIAWSTILSCSPGACPRLVEGTIVNASYLSIDLNNNSFSSIVPLLCTALIKGTI